MPVYTYKAREATGKLIRGSMDAPTADALAKQLQTMGYILTDAQETEQKQTVNLQKVGEKFSRI